MVRNPFDDLGRIFDGLGNAFEGMSRGFSRAERGFSSGRFSMGLRGLQQAGRASGRGFRFSRKGVAWASGALAAVVTGFLVLAFILSPTADNAGRIIQHTVEQEIPNPVGFVTDLIFAGVLLVGGFLLWKFYQDNKDSI